MEKIHPGLAAKLAANPNTELQVLITLRENVHPDQLGLSGFTVLMNHILSAKLGKQKILTLAAMPEVQAIEADEEVEAL